MGGIQSISTLPGDPTFNLSGNRYDVASYKRICAEFGIDPTSDFRFTSRKNNGLGDVYIGVSGHGPMKTGAEYPGGFYKFADEGGKAKDGNLLAFIELDSVAFSQYDWFAPNKSSGLTQAGLARINQSIEAFVYCILGAQVNVRSSIIGTGGRVKEAQINPPNSHPSNPIHKATMAADEETVSEKTVSEKKEINKTALVIGGVAVVALLFMASH